MPLTATAGWLDIDADCQEEPGCPGLIQNGGEIGLVPVSNLAPHHPLQKGSGAAGGKEPRRSLDEGGIDACLGRRCFHLIQRQAARRMPKRFRQAVQLGSLMQDESELLVAVDPSTVGYDRPRCR